MANSTVTIRLAPDQDVTLATDNPNIGALVKKIVDLRETLDVESIEVDCESTGFDTKSFTDVVRDSCRQFLEAIKLEKSTFDNAMAELNKQCQNDQGSHTASS